jgi:hypothetical protein
MSAKKKEQFPIYLIVLFIALAVILGVAFMYFGGFPMM